VMGETGFGGATGGGAAAGLGAEIFGACAVSGGAPVCVAQGIFDCCSRA
jgi:hypothetical protein